MKPVIFLIFVFLSLVGSYAQQRAVLVGTNNTVIQPTNFWSADASNARTGLGLGTAATNPASAFQPASTNLTLLASGDGSVLTNINISGLGVINISNITGLQSALDQKLSTNGSALNLTNFPSSILQTGSSITNFPAGLLRTNGDGSGLTNLPVPEFASNVLSTISIANGGTGATNASNARVNLGGTDIGINIFTASNAAAARTFLELGTAATNPSTAFQPSSSVISNLANNNASSLTNISASGIVGAVALASNVTGTPALASNVTGVVALANGGTGGTNASTARNGIGLGTTNTLTIAGIVSDNITINSGGGINLQAQLTNAENFRTNIGLPWSGLTNADASAFRTALGLGTAATNAASSFQPSSIMLSNLASSNGGSLTNIQATSLVGTIPSSNIATVNFSNLAGTLVISSGGTGATNAANARQNLGSTTVGDAVFIATNAAAARTALSLGTAATSAVTDFQPADSDLTNIAANNAINLTNFPTLLLRTNGSAAGLTGFVGTTNAATARTNLGLGWSALTNTDSTSFRNAIGLGTTNNVRFGSVSIGGGDLVFSNDSIYWGTNLRFSPEDVNFYAAVNFDTPTIAATTRTNLGLPWSGLTNTNAANFRNALGIGETAFVTFDSLATRFGTNFQDITFAVDQIEAAFGVPIVFSFTNATQNAAISRTNLGLGWPALTNTNAGTGLVSVDTNGEVVSPTNFWQAAPIATTLQNSTPVANSTNAATNARLLFLFSLAPSTVGVTNTITLPTNGSTFNGDVATITHSGPTSSVTAVRQLGASTNIITLNQPEESVRFLYRNNQWTLMDNISYVESIYFSGTNAAANAAASRTNLGLGSTNNVVFNSLQLGGPTNAALFILDEQTILGDGVLYLEAGQMIFKTPIEFNNTTNSATTRTNLGLGATNNVTFAGLTNNGDITINQTATNNGLLYIYRTNAEPFLGLANFIASNNVTVSNESLFRVGVAEATNKAAQFGFRSTNTNGNGVAVFSVFGYNALMMIGPSDPAAGTNPIQATIYSIAPTNKVMTLITTNTGATLFHRPIEFETTTNAATTRTNLGLGGGITTNLILKNGANVDTYMNFSNGILIYGSTTPP